MFLPPGMTACATDVILDKLNGKGKASDIRHIGRQTKQRVIARHLSHVQARGLG